MGGVDPSHGRRATNDPSRAPSKAAAKAEVLKKGAWKLYHGPTARAHEKLGRWKETYDPSRRRRPGFAAGKVHFQRNERLLELAMKRAEKRNPRASVFDDPDVKRLMKIRDRLLKHPK